VMTGKNAFGGGGPGIGNYYTPAIDILTGPIFFFDKALQPPAGEGSAMMWTVQLDVDIDFKSAPPAAPAAPAAMTPPPPPAVPPSAPAP
jgi:hypothetical protein